MHGASSMSWSTATRDGLANDRYTGENELRTLNKRQKGRCAHCGRPLADVFHIDHITALARGGDNSLANKQLLCIDCHKLKTFGSKATTLGSDIFEIRKTQRLAKGKKKSKHRWPRRKFGEHKTRDHEADRDNAGGGPIGDGGVDKDGR